MGLVSAEQSYTPTFQCGDSEKFFTLPNEIFLLDLPLAAFMVYAYLLLIEDRRTHTCHPSYNTIAAVTGMAKNTVMKSVGVPLDKELITMEHSRYFDQHGMKWNGNNLYTILPTQQAVDVFINGNSTSWNRTRSTDVSASGKMSMTAAILKQLCTPQLFALRSPA